VSRVTLDLDRVQSMLVAIFDTFIPNVVLLVGLAVVMVWIDPGFGLLALTIAPPLFFVTYRYTLRIKHAARRAREADAKIAAHANETLSAVRSVQAFNREDYEDDRFADRNSESLAASLEAVSLRAKFTPIVDIVSLAGTLLVTYVGAKRVIDGTMSLGIFLVFLSYLKSLYKPMRALSKMTYVVSRGTTSAERVQQVLEVEERIPQAETAIVPASPRGEIELRDISFRYAPGLPAVLEHTSLHIEAGEHVGVVGRTGAGKSTLISLIPRFYDVDEGAVLIDGVDVRALDLGALRRIVSVVLQDPVLFFGSVLDNIRYGDPEAPMEKVMAAVESAHVDEFLDRLPQGLDTEIGERGTTLSGGQRQRIAIARAIVADSPILILDEPTTGLDGESEAYVLDGLERLAEGRTTIVISHHAAALRGVTRVVHVAHGHIEELALSAARTEMESARHGNGSNANGNGNGNGDRPASDLDLLADATSERTFATIADGYAPHQVNAFLAELAEQLREGARRERDLLEQLEAARGVDGVSEPA
jgi:subfamily B ATP-binding cassette protein MsbA